ncbi:putative transposase, Tnp1/En/Spm [Rosa chinensis]|uniref:Putative transposase, Tnp1/En/Spm n=1 Tax=Rosa chinensis TaxID=74649 RepID=A0A2P6RH34_ROSCH|nr:putative transposase, Tnp1/En/Spm [Rosa chinensis]
MVVDLDIQKGECQQIGKEYELASGSIDNVVAVATIIEGNGECNNELIHGIPLGEGNIRVSIVRSIVDEALLPFPIKDEILTVRDAIGTYVAWPKDLIIFPTEKMAAKSKGMKKLRKRAEGNDDDEEEDLDMQSLPPNVLTSLKIVCMWVKETLTNGKTIICTFDEKIFGKVSKTFVNKMDINNFATMKEVSGSCISIYISYLHGVLKKSKMVEMVGFVCPTDIGAIGCGNPIERSRAIANRMRNAKRG